MLVVVVGLSGCQTAQVSRVPVPSLAARPEDVETIDGIVRAFYEVVNVGPTEPRQWGRDRTLYVPWVRFVGIGKGAPTRPSVVVWSHQDLVDESEPLVQQGFRERELFRRVERYGNIVHLASTYETLLGTGEPQRSRGVNSLELYWDGTRYWIASVMWQSEDEAHPIPPELLPPTR
jgi:hypothetical protein